MTIYQDQQSQDTYATQLLFENMNTSSTVQSLINHEPKQYKISLLLSI